MKNSQLVPEKNERLLKGKGHFYIQDILKESSCLHEPHGTSLLTIGLQADLNIHVPRFLATILDIHEAFMVS